MIMANDIAMACLVSVLILCVVSLAILVYGAIVACVEERSEVREQRRRLRKAAEDREGRPGGVPVSVADLCRVSEDDPSVLGGYVRFMSLPGLRDALADPPEYAGVVLVYDDGAWIGTGFHSFGVWYWEDGTVIRRVTHWRDLLV
jgi:hypothetical protein